MNLVFKITPLLSFIVLAQYTFAHPTKHLSLNHQHQHPRYHHYHRHHAHVHQKQAPLQILRALSNLSDQKPLIDVERVVDSVTSENTKALELGLVDGEERTHSDQSNTTITVAFTSIAHWPQSGLQDMVLRLRLGRWLESDSVNFPTRPQKARLVDFPGSDKRSGADSPYIPLHGKGANNLRCHVRVVNGDVSEKDGSSSKEPKIHSFNMTSADIDFADPESVHYLETKAIDALLCDEI